MHLQVISIITGNKKIERKYIGCTILTCIFKKFSQLYNLLSLGSVTHMLSTSIVMTIKKKVLQKYAVRLLFPQTKQ